MARDQFTEILRRMADLERRINNVIRPARVTSVDAKKYTHKVTYALDPDGKEIESPDIPWSEQRAGDLGTWNPPTVDEQVFLLSPGGEIGLHSWTMGMGFSDKFPPIHDKAGEKVSMVTDKQGNKHYVHIDSSGVHTHTKGEAKVEAGTVYMKKKTGGPGDVNAKTPPSATGLD